jgi:HSP20 family protein
MRNNQNNTSNVSLARRNNAVSQNTLSPFGFGTGLFDDLYPVLFSPFQVMERMQQDMDRLFSHVMATPTADQQRSPALMTTANLLSPTVDVSETEKGYHIEIDLPGVPQDAIEVNVVEGTLTIRAELNQESSRKPAGEAGEGQTANSEQNGQRQYHYRERRWGRFERMFHLPPNANEESIDADFANGVLTLTIAKKVNQVEGQRGRRIAIGSAQNVSSNGETNEDLADQKPTSATA